jgi:hypothetical protein
MAIPAWLTNEQSLALATWGLVVVTALLVVGTFLLFLDSWKKGKEQRSRWAREDQQRADDTKPKTLIELAMSESEPDVVVLCYNLGDNTFVIDKLVVSCGQSTRYADLKGPLIALPGTHIRIKVSCTEWLQTKTVGEANTTREAKVVLILKGATGTVTTVPVWFCFRAAMEHQYEWSVGRLADRQPGTIVSHPRMISAEVLASPKPE